MSHKHDRAPGSSGTAFLLNFLVPLILFVAFILAVPGSPVKLGGTYGEPFDLEGTVTGHNALFLTVDTPQGERMIPFGNSKKFPVGTRVTLRLRECYTVATTDSGTVRTIDGYQCLGVEAR